MPPGFRRLAKVSAERNGSLLCVGLDPHLKYVQNLLKIEGLPWETTADVLSIRPGTLRRILMGWIEGIVNATYPFAIAFKPNVAFFEQYGPVGMEVLATLPYLIEEAHEGTSFETVADIILDCKRGDIGTSAEAYAISAYDYYKADAVTLNLYMGTDVFSGFNKPGKTCFVLSKTSNSTADMLQRSKIGDVPLYLNIISMLDAYKDANPELSIGFVVGATYPEDLRAVRRLTDAWLLVPGIGAQGGILEDVLDAAVLEDGSHRVLINISRAITDSDDPSAVAKQFAKATSTNK